MPAVSTVEADFEQHIIKFLKNIYFFEILKESTTECVWYVTTCC